MTIREMKKNKDIESLFNVVEILYQLKNNPEVWENIKDRSVSEGVKNISLTDMITALEEIGGEEYQRYTRKIKL